LPKTRGATLHLLNVVEMASAFGEPAISATLHSRAEEKAIHALNGIAANHHGRHGISHLILGSVAEEVVRSAPCAVLHLTPTACGR
jgi:hypothetical protein